MREVTISEFRTKCFSLLNQVQKTKKPILVTRFGKPVAEVIPASPKAGPGDWFGSMKDEIRGAFDTRNRFGRPALTMGAQ